MELALRHTQRQTQRPVQQQGGCGKARGEQRGGQGVRPEVTKLLGERRPPGGGAHRSSGRGALAGVWQGDGEGALTMG